MPLILLLLLVPAVLVALTPLLLIQRYRVGTSRRPARRWMAMVGVGSTAFSAIMILMGAAFTNVWVPQAFGDAALGLSVGCVLGAAGVVLSRWEPTVRTLHYTPNRWLVLFVTLVVTGRILFGLYRTYVAAESGLAGGELVTAFGVAESLGAGGVVIGYYLAYNAGVVWKIRRWERRPLRPA